MHIFAFLTNIIKLNNNNYNNNHNNKILYTMLSL